MEKNSFAALFSQTTTIENGKVGELFCTVERVAHEHRFGFVLNPPCARFWRSSGLCRWQGQTSFRHLQSGSTIGPRCPPLRLSAFSGCASSRAFCFAHSSFAKTAAIMGVGYLGG